jgi:antitoxin component HigA of HigAB toxin-antitoxin module
MKSPVTPTSSLVSTIEPICPFGVVGVHKKDRGMNASDLGRLVGKRSLGLKILNGDRGLSKAHIKILAKHFHVSPAVLLD